MSEETPPASNSPRRRIDRALALSIVAIAISLVGTGVAAFEAYLTRQQQELLIEQRAASAWPYIEAIPYTNFGADDITIRYILTNKGIGPAIIGDARYLVGGIETESYFLDDVVAERMPGLDIDLSSNQQVDSSVMAPGEQIVVAELITRRFPGTDDTVRAIRDQLRIEFCYCSVYGRCWRFDGSRQPRRSQTCEARITSR